MLFRPSRSQDKSKSKDYKQLLSFFFLSGEWGGLFFGGGALLIVGSVFVMIWVVLALVMKLC